MKQLLSLFALGLAFGASASGTVDLQGTTFRSDTLEHYYVAPGTTHTHLELTAGNRRVQVFAVTIDRADASYRPTVSPRVVIGNDMCLNAETVSSMGTRKTTDSRQYVAGVNGDFFITASFAGNHEFGNAILGYPNMSCVIDGKIAAPDMIDIVSRENALIIGPEGMWIDATDLTYKVLNNDGSRQAKAQAVNYPRRDNEMMVYNSYNGASTRTSAGGREIALRMAPGAEWKINATTKFIVEGEWSTAGDMPIPADGIVISCGKDYADSFVDGLAAGDVVKLKIILSLPAFGGIKPDITDVIGGDVRILNQGTVTTEAIRWINTPGSQYPRSLAGYSQDRTRLVMAAVDGGQAASTGLSYFESADLMAALGCYDALDMDGGGSTAMWTAHAGIVNRPRDGAERAVGNALFVALDAAPDSKVASIRFADHARTLPLLGAYTPVVYGYNAAGQLISTAVEGCTFEAPAGMATISGATVMPTATGCFALTARLGDMTATMPVDVQEIGEVAVRRSTVLIDNVRTTAVELLAATPLGDMPLANTAFEWSSDNSAVATVDANGTVNGHADGSATIVGRRGELEVSVTAMVQIPDASVIPVEANLGDDSWRITRSGVGSDMSITPDGNGGCALQFTVTNPRSANIALNKDIDVYSLPDGFSLTVDTKGSVLKEVSVRVRPDNASQPVMVSTGELSGATTVNCPLEGSIDIDDINVFPLHFSALRIVPLTGAEGGKNYDIALSDVGFSYSQWNSGVENVTNATSRPLVVERTAEGIRVPGATSITVYNTLGAAVASASGENCAVRARGVVIVSAIVDGTPRAVKAVF